MSNDVLFLAGQFLPDEDKLKLIGRVPGIENYVKSFNTSTKRYKVGMRAGTLLRRLPNLRKVVTTTSPWSLKYRREYQLLMTLAEFNPKITEFRGFREQDILDYIERVKKLDLTYDARQVKKVFNYSRDRCGNFLEKYPDVKLKLAIATWSQEDENVLNERRHLIHDLELELGYVLRLELKSVRKVTSVTSKLSSNLRFLPNVEEVRICSFHGYANPNVIQSLLGVKNLKKLTIGYIEAWTEANFHEFKLILMKPSLKHLEFKDQPDPERSLLKAFLDCERNDFKSFKFYVNLYHNIYDVVVENKIITINKPIEFSLAKLFSKFKRIKEIKINTNGKKFAEQIRDETNLIVETLPPNRSLRVQIGRDVYKY